MLAERRWLEGPEFLKEDPDSWPILQMLGPVDPEVLEVKRKPACLACVKGSMDPVEKLFGRYSRWPDLLRGVARGLLLKTAWRYKTAMETTLRPEHLRRAEEAIVKHVQAQHYGKEIAALRANGQVEKSSSMAKLSPHLQGGLLISTGRLRNAQVPEAVRCPFVLPNGHHVTKILVRHLHERAGHAGRDYVLAELRQHYWVRGATTVVKQVLSQCVLCRRRESRPCEQMMADLPADRVEAREQCREQQS